MENKLFDYIGLMLAAAVWGANFGVSRLAMDTFDPVLFTFIRFGFAVPCLFLLLKWKEGSIGIPLKEIMKLMVIGFFGVTMLETMVMYSIKYTTLANASLLNVAPWPIFAALFAPFFTRETLTARLMTGGAIAIVGVCFIILGGGEGLDISSRHMVGNLLALAVSMIGALINLSCMPLMKQYSALRVSAWYILFGSLFMFPLTLKSWEKVDWLSLAAPDYGAILYNVLICTVLAILLWNACMYRIGATRANFFRYVVPASAVLAGYLLFAERITVWQLVGAACMAAGLVWISMERGKEASSVAEHPQAIGDRPTSAL